MTLRSSRSMPTKMKRRKNSSWRISRKTLASIAVNFDSVFEKVPLLSLWSKELIQEITLKLHPACPMTTSNLKFNCLRQFPYYVLSTRAGLQIGSGYGKWHTYFYAFNSPQEWTAQLEREMGFKTVTKWATGNDHFFSSSKSSPGLELREAFPFFSWNRSEGDT